MTRFLFVSAGRWGRLLTSSEAVLIWLVYVLFSYIETAVSSSSEFSVVLGGGQYLSVDVAIRGIFFAIVVMLAMMSVGLYNARLRESIIGIVNRFIFSFVICVILFSLLGAMGGIMAMFWYPPFSAILLAMLVVFGFRYAVTLIVGDAIFKTRILVLGAGERAAIIERRMRRAADRKGFKLLGYHPMEGDSPGCIDKSKIIPEIESLERWVVENDVDEIIIACDERRCQLPVSSLFQARTLGVNIIDILDFIERETGQVAVNMMYPSWMIYSSGFNSTDSLKNVFDRLFNISLAMLILAFTWPVMLITALIIFLEDRGPIFFTQRRVGFRGEVFRIMKFRSMRVDAEKNGAQWATKNDNRTTKIGNFIRLYRIDELPQLFNVIRGDMGFVGPRPEQPEFVDRLALNIPYYNERHNVKPGLTGWAQLRYRYGASEEDALEKLKYDLYYIKNRSILFDLLIFLQTVEVVLFAKGSR